MNKKKTHKYYISIPEVWYRTVEIEMSDELFQMGNPEESAVTLARINLDPKEVMFEYSHEMGHDYWKVEEIAE